MWTVLFRQIVVMVLLGMVDVEEKLPQKPCYIKKCLCKQFLQFTAHSWFQVHFYQLQKQMARL